MSGDDLSLVRIESDQDGFRGGGALVIGSLLQSAQQCMNLRRCQIPIAVGEGLFRFVAAGISGHAFFVVRNIALVVSEKIFCCQWSLQDVRIAQFLAKITGFARKSMRPSTWNIQ